ncbi:MAG: phosphate regulon transcriptional regulatory protein PhoB [Gammaproteobacteria bacterium]|nr:MAG: phosphate regulon transcriptional regulatory protein PhoB [Gammaproteobacteria bacterium]|tara:strand:- start:9627 stop:10325 length:699 start_codon:yes stop_codon:yes gene_type:complete
MDSLKILVVEDERAIREMVSFHLQRANFNVVEAANCQEAMIMISDEQPDLAIIDWMLPDMSGLELTRNLRRNKDNEDLAIIMLTAKNEERDMIAGLKGGADDYITKPFSPKELIARIGTVLRRSQPSAIDEIIKSGEIEIDSAAHRVKLNGEQIKLGPTEYRLLKFLITHVDRVFSRSQLLDKAWGGNVYVEERTVDVHIRRLRAILAVSGADKYIQTVRGAGYRYSLSNKE